MVDDYEVGFCKPPKSSRFKKGQSGNPKGRPKGSKNFDACVREELDKKVRLKGQDKKISKREAAALQLVNKAAQGDLRAIAAIRASEQAGVAYAPTSMPGLTEIERQVLIALEKRLSEMDPSHEP